MPLRISAVLAGGLILTACQSEVLVPLPYPPAPNSGALTELLFIEINPSGRGQASADLRVEVLDAQAPRFSLAVPEGITTRWSAVLSPYAACDEGFVLGLLVPSPTDTFIPKLVGPDYQRFRSSSLDGRFEPWQVVTELPELALLSYEPTRCSAIFEVKARTGLPVSSRLGTRTIVDVAVTNGGAVAALRLPRGDCREATELAYFTLGSEQSTAGQGPPCIERMVEDGTTGEHVVAAHRLSLSRLDRLSQVVATVPVDPPIAAGYSARALLRTEGLAEVFAVYSTTVAPEQTFVVALAPLTLERTRISPPIPGAVALAMAGAGGTISLLTTDRTLIDLSPELSAQSTTDLQTRCRWTADFEASAMISVDEQLVIANVGPGPAINVISADRGHCRSVEGLGTARARAIDLAPGPGKRLVIFLEGFEGSSDTLAVISAVPQDGSRTSPTPLRTTHPGLLKGLYRAGGGVSWALTERTLEHLTLPER